MRAIGEQLPSLTPRSHLVNSLQEHTRAAKHWVKIRPSREGQNRLALPPRTLLQPGPRCPLLSHLSSQFGDISDSSKVHGEALARRPGVGLERGPPAGAFSSSLSPSSLLACFLSRPCPPQVPLCLPPAPLPSSPGAPAASAGRPAGQPARRGAEGRAAPAGRERRRAAAPPPAGGAEGGAEGRGGPAAVRLLAAPQKARPGSGCSARPAHRSAHGHAHTRTHRGTHGHTDTLARTRTHGSAAMCDARCAT